MFIKLPQSPSFREYEPSSGLNARAIWSPNGQNLLLTGTDQLPSKAYRLVWRLLKPDNQKVVKLDEAVDLVRPDFITISNVYWIEKDN